MQKKYLKPYRMGSQINIPVELVIEREVTDKYTSVGRAWLCCIIGATGSGKSMVSLKLAKMIDSNFTMNNICWDLEQFLTRFRELRARPDEGRGSILVLEESENSLSSRQSQSTPNQIFNTVVSTLRFTNIGLIYNLPGLYALEKTARLTLHTLLATEDVDRKHAPPIIASRSGVRWDNVVKSSTPSAHDTEIHYRFPVLDVHVINKCGEQYIRHCKISTVWFTLPDPELVKEYNIQKKAYFDRVLSEASSKLDYHLRKESAKRNKIGIEQGTQGQTPAYTQSSTAAPAPAPASPNTSSVLQRISGRRVA